jgi:multiple sugar transport system permease protein
MMKHPRAFFTQLLKQILCLGMVVLVLAPILLTLFAAFKTKADMVRTSPLWLPPASRITFANFSAVWKDKYLFIGFRNTFVILIVSLFFNVLFGTGRRSSSNASSSV